MRKYSAIKISQPFSEYFVISMSAFDLLNVTFSDPLRYDEQGQLRGNQRKIREDRIKEIGEYIKGDDVAFPNSIIISANYTDKGYLCDDKTKRWKYYNKDGGYIIEIPTDEKLASIIDGQHRLNGFKNVTVERQKEIELLVCIYFDLPNPYQAYIFATINYNQKQVDRSLALEQWGFSLQTDNQETWSPEMLGVFLSKKLNTDPKSPFYKKIIVAPQNEENLFNDVGNDNEVLWKVSTSSIVDSIVKLISSNPKNDLNKLRQLHKKERKREELEQNLKIPLRKYYLNYNDLLIYKVILNYFIAVNELLFNIEGDKTSFIRKTVGIQALFEVLKEILKKELENKKDISINYFKEKLEPFSKVDFTDSFFTASGIGKSRIRNLILISLEYIDIEKIRNKNDVDDYKRLLNITK